MSDREAVLGRLKEAAPTSDALPLPEYDPAIMVSEARLDPSEPDDRVFAKNFRAVNGRVYRFADDLVGFLTSKGHLFGYCDPALLGFFQNTEGLTIETEFDRAKIDEYTFGITKATGAIAESGSLILDDFQTSDRLAALAPWVHIAVLNKTDIHATIPDAISAFGDAPNIVWATGPSKTADIEGILIEGVHGPGEQIALIVG